MSDYRSHDEELARRYHRQKKLGLIGWLLLAACAMLIFFAVYPLLARVFPVLPQPF